MISFEFIRHYEVSFVRTRLRTVRSLCHGTKRRSINISALRRQVFSLWFSHMAAGEILNELSLLLGQGCERPQVNVDQVHWAQEGEEEGEGQAQCQRPGMQLKTNIWIPNAQDFYKYCL